MSFMAECCADKKEDQINIDNNFVELHITIVFLNMCKQDTLLTIRIQMSPEKLL